MDRTVWRGIRGVTSSYEFTNPKVLQQLLSLVRMNCIKFLSAISASIDEDTVNTTRMVLQETCGSVDMAMDYDPSRVGRAVLPDLGHGIHL